MLPLQLRPAVYVDVNVWSGSVRFHSVHADYVWYVCAHFSLQCRHFYLLARRLCGQ